VSVVALCCYSALFTAQELRTVNPLANSISWVYSRGDGNLNSRDVQPEQARALIKTVRGEFLWYQEDGKGYLIIEPELLATVKAMSLERALYHKPQFHQGNVRLTKSQEAQQIELSRQFNELIMAAAKRAIQEGAFWPMPHPNGVRVGKLVCADGHEYYPSPDYKFCYRDGRPLN
jgi:hypothetical protein